MYDSYRRFAGSAKRHDECNYSIIKKHLPLHDNADTKQKLNELENKETFTLTEQELQKYAGVYDIERIFGCCYNTGKRW